IQKIENINKLSTSDEKLDLWKEIQDVSDSTIKEILTDKFKKQVSASFFNIFMKFANEPTRQKMEQDIINYYKAFYRNDHPRYKEFIISLVQKNINKASDDLIKQNWELVQQNTNSLLSKPIFAMEELDSILFASENNRFRKLAQ